MQADGDGCCAKKTGYYCDWNLTLTALESEEWVELGTFRRIMRLLKYITFTVGQQRTTAKTALGNLKREAPFQRCSRFPSCSAYVNITCSVYSQQLKNLTMALDYKDREKEKQMKFHNEKNDPEVTNVSSAWGIDDALTAYYNALESITNELCKRNEVFDRVYFESYYELKWCEGDCPPCDKTPYKDPPGKRPGGPDEPNKPDPNDPNRPGNRNTYEDVAKALTDLGLNVSEYRFFKDPSYNDDFQCGQDLMSFSELADRRKQLPSSKNFIVINPAEYGKCSSGSSMIIYRYDRVAGRLERDTLVIPKRIIFSDDEWLALFES